MNNNLKISFGAKIPIRQCNIISKHDKTPERATIYELDCKNYSDIIHLASLKGKWRFKEFVSASAEMKYTYPEIFDYVKIYLIEDEKSETLGLMECEEYGDYTDIIYLEAPARKKHKYIGMNLVSQASIEALKSDTAQLKVCDPVKSAQGFYEGACGFTVSEDNELEMSKSSMKSLIQKTVQKTKSKGIDLRG